MSVKPQRAFFVVIFFITGVLIGHYLPIWDKILPEFEGEAPTLAEALKDVLGMTSESLEKMTKTKTADTENSEEKLPANAVKTAQKEGAYKFIDTVVTLSKIISAREMMVSLSEKEQIYIILEGVEHKFEAYIPTLRKYLLGQKLWCKAAIPHSMDTKTLVVYAYVIPKSWNESMGKPQLSEELLLNRIINKQFISTVEK